MAKTWNNIPEKKVLATLKEKSALKGTVSEKFDIYVDGAVPGGEGDVQGISMTIDPSTYVMTTQLIDGKGGNVGSPATIDLPLESMVVGGEYDEENKSIILTLKNGQTVEFSVADLVSGLQTEITAQNPLSADYIAETNNNKVMTSAERTKLAGIAAGAEVNVQSDWNVTNSSSDAFIKNKPTNVSAFTNDAGYQNASQVSSAIASAVGDITSFEYQVVQTLPQTGEKGVVYLVPNSGTTPNIYDEYIWVNNAFEKIGTTEMDLSDYYTKTQTDTLLGAKADQSTTYTKTEVDTALGNKADSSDVYTKTQVDTALGNKANSSDVYSKSEVNTALAGKVDAVNPADLPSGAYQGSVVVTDDKENIDPSSVEEGQIVVDPTTKIVYVISKETEPGTTTETLVFTEVGKEQVVFLPMTITDLQALTFSMDNTVAEINTMINAGMSVFYRLVLPQAVSGLQAGTYDFRPFYSSNAAILCSMLGASSTNAIMGVAWHTASGTPYLEMRSLQNQIDSNNKLSADLIDSSSSDDKTYQTGTGAPTTSTAGSVGEMYVDKSTGAVYACTGVNGGVHTWTEIIAKDRVKTLTTADYNYPTSGTKTSIALWLLPSGVYNIGEALSYNPYAYGTTTTAGKDENHFIKINRQGLATVIEVFSPLGIMRYSTNASTGAKGDFAQLAFVDDLNTTDTSRGLTANQGKVLNEKIPVITMTSTDPGEGSALKANHFIAVYEV